MPIGQTDWVEFERSPQASTKGFVLVAVPLLDEPTFHRTVIYMLEHTDEGALGVVINRPTTQTLVRGLEAWITQLSPPQVIFSGGPVMDNTLIAIASVGDRAPSEGLAPLDHDLYTVDLSLVPDDLSVELLQLRVFRGYSGWGAGQLEDELEEGSWLVLPCEALDVFTADPDDVWRHVLRRAGGSKAHLADAPDELSWN